MIRLGITGGIGSGKSTISQLLKLRGIPIYISDVESKKLTETSPIIQHKLIRAFGSKLYKNNKLNKPLFANIIFNDKEKLALANSIIHPEVDKHFNQWCVQKAKQYPLAGLESAILYESGMVKLTDKVLLIYTPIEERIKRTMARDNISLEKVMERMNNQDADENKLRKADYILYNDEKQSVIKQIEYLLKNIVKDNGSII